MNRPIAIVASLVLMAAKPVPSSPSLGKAEATCRANESGPALLVTAAGLKDHKGLLRAELYPDNDSDFLADDNVLINAGKAFRRTDLDLKPGIPATLCLRVPAPGQYALSLLHDRDRNLKFGVFADGIGFSGNPRLKRSKPKAASAVVVAGPGLTHVTITLNYLRGLSFSPLGRK